MALAMSWVSRIIAAVLVMVLPGLAGQWLDQRLGTTVLALAGFAFGLIGGVFYLLAITKASEKQSSKKQDTRDLK